MQGCARTSSEVSWLGTLNNCRTVLRFRVPFAFKLLLPARNLTPAQDIWVICNKLHGECVYPNTVLKIENTAILYLPGMDSTNMK